MNLIFNKSARTVSTGILESEHNPFADWSPKDMVTYVIEDKNISAINEVITEVFRLTFLALNFY
jgi:hypothetical protein